VNTALVHLGKKDRQAAREDIKMIYFWLGVSFMMILQIALIVWIPSDKAVPNWVEPLSECIHAYYFLATFIIICFGTTLCIHVFKKSGINYTYIFEIEGQANKVDQYQMLRISSALLCCWLIALAL